MPLVVTAADEKTGAVVSITIALLPASEEAFDVAGKVSVASLPSASLIVPPLKESELVAT